MSRQNHILPPELLSGALKYARRVTTPDGRRGGRRDRFRGRYVTPEPRANLLWAAVDLDGTLADPVWTAGNPTSEIGPPRWDRVELLEDVVAAGYKVVIHTSRPWTDYENIEGWLNHWDIPFDKIQCGKLLAKIYIDDRARWSEADSWLPEEGA